MNALRFDRVSTQVSVQDLGRPGYAAIGVGRGGAADRAALRRANRIVGNDEGAAGFEAVLGDFAITALAPITVAVTGAAAAVTRDGAGVASEEPIRLRTGQRLEVGRARVGLRCYLAVRGGIAAQTVLGSRSSSPTLGMGPAPVRAGDEFALTDAIADDVPAAGGGGRWRTDTVVVEATAGPRADLFTADSLARLFETEWTATGELDRVGVRLSGAALQRRQPDVELASEPVVRGAVQVPPIGQPLVFLADHPITGGYPVIAVVGDADTDALAQLRPGDRLRFRRTPPRWR